MTNTDVVADPNGASEPVDPASLSGLEMLRAYRDTPDMHVGISLLLGMRIADLEEGRVVFELNTKSDFLNPLGTVHGGITATLADSVMGCAVHSTLPAGASYTTVDLALTYLRSVPPDGRLLQAEGKVIHLGGRLATAEARVTDDRDRLIATATTTCMLFRRNR